MSEQTETALPELASTSKPSVVKILVVDDDVVMRNVLSRLLKNLGYEAKTASGGRQALDLLMEEEFQLMLVDVMMPEMDGFSLIRVFRQASSREIPVIMMSGSEDPDTVSKVFQSGAEDFLPKPIKEEILKPRIQKCLDYRDRKIRERYYKELMKEEKRLKKELNERIEKNMKEIEEYKKQVAESIETPMQIVMSTINDLMSGKYESEQYKIALVTILKSLGSSDLYKPAFVDYIKKANMDHNTRNWLVSQFTRDGDEAYIKEGLQKSPPIKIEPATPKAVKKLSENLPFDLETYKPAATLKTLDYNTVDFENSELKKHVLYYFKDLDFYNLYGVSPFKLWNMLGCLENVYKENHYHNFKHAMDVTQYAFFLVTDEKISELLSSFNKFCLLVSALCHDIDHPGMNNNFLMNTRHELALIYNDKSVLENHHAACAFQILSQEKYNILENLSEEQYREFRKTVVSVVLSTDMANHFSICSKFETRISTGPLSKENPEDHMQLMKILMKCADINNSSRPFNIAKKWANMCIQEFLSQGDKEKSLSLPVSPLMDRNTLNFPKSQIDFTDFIAIPLFTHLTKAFTHLTYILNQIQDNRKTWKRVFDEQDTQKNSQTPTPQPAALQPVQQPTQQPAQQDEPEKKTEPETLPAETTNPVGATTEVTQEVPSITPYPLKRSNGKTPDNSVVMLIVASIIALVAVIIFAKFR